MFQGLNKVQIIGNLGQDPEMRYTQNGQAVTNFSVAVSRDRKQGEEWVSETDWFRVVAWGKQAESLDGMASKGHLTKGTKVYVEGRLQTRSYTTDDGVEKTSVEIIANNVLILSSKSKAAVFDDEVPF